MRRPSLIVVLMTLVLAGVGPALAQTSDDWPAMRTAVEALRESQQRIEKELAEIKTLLRTRSAGAPDDDPKSVQLTIGDDPFKGDRAAKLVLVDFTDFQ